jgi:hypothetical protein
MCEFDSASMPDPTAGQINTEPFCCSSSFICVGKHHFGPKPSISFLKGGGGGSAITTSQAFFGTGKITELEY